MSSLRKLAAQSQKFSIAFAAVAVVFAVMTPSVEVAAGSSNKFEIISMDSGKKLGDASYSINKKKNGYDVNSTFNLLLNTGNVNDLQTSPSSAESRGGGGDFLDLQYSYDYKVDLNGSFLSGYANNNATQTLITLSPNKDRSAITVTQTRTGTQFGSQTVQLTKPDFLVIPNFDPGGFQVLVTAALEHPHADNSYLVVIPANPDTGQNDSSGGFVTLSTQPDVTGTLDHQSIPVKHFATTFRAGKADIYTDATGNIMEVIMAPLHAKYVRAKFALTLAP